MNPKQLGGENVVNSENNVGQKEKKFRASRKRSLVWVHYDSFVNQKGEHKSKCRYCSKEYFSNTRVHGTSTLRGHLRVCEQYPGNKSTGQTSLTIQIGDGDDDRRMIGWKFDQQSIRKALAYMIVVDELPFKFVEDTWMSVQRINYMSLTAHYVDNDWILRKKVLNFCPISSHCGVDIGKAVEMCLIKWGIESNVFTITVDNATANDVAVAYLKSKFANWEKCVLEAKWLHVRCIAHIMNLIVQDGLSHIGKSVDRVRVAVKYIRQSPQRLRKFKEFAGIEKCPSTKTLILDVPTRWNSTYMMLETAQTYERAFARYDSEDRHYRDDLEKTGVPESSDWANVRRLARFLQHFYDLTLKVSRTRYVTSNTFLDDITSIDAVLKSCITGVRDSGLVEMAKLMKSKYDKYFGSIDKCNMLTLVGSMLDPTRKKEYMEVLLVDVYGDLEGTSMSGMIEDFLYEIYEDYVRIHTPPDSPTKSQASGSSASMDKRSTPTVMEPSIMLKPKVRMEMKRRKTENGFRDSKSELDKYLKEDTEDESEGFDVLSWWKLNSPRFPILSLVARDVLAIPISTVASESVFSTSGRVLNAFRSSLTPAIVECLICTQDWLRSTAMPVDVAENWEELIQVEEELLQAV
uniref:zinc finger BED domain-containing protein RICESLEEPER 2-like n=1 Tax=Erigeron canadensis TaxID=72917 RepID=UPI001CB8FF24|nr:zinc finger BED domain-containing protein RICESLEEPER 2-like [Erigeron canadensis]